LAFQFRLRFGDFRLRDDLKELAGKLRNQIAASEKMTHDSKLHLAEVEKHFARLAKKPA